MKQTLYAILLSTLCLTATATGLSQVESGPLVPMSTERGPTERGPTERGPTERGPTDLYFSGQDAILTAQEKESLSIAAKWQSVNLSGIKPVAGPDGSVRFIVGAQQITVVCAVLQVCDIELQPGEQVNNLNIGDPRYLVEPAISGSGASEVQHLVIKPLDVGLATSLMVSTNRRSYSIFLRSHRNEFMPRVSFIYPEETNARWDAMRSHESRDKQENTLPNTGEYLGKLNFNYTLTGKASWKPLRVYNDGLKTIIQMPTAMSQTEAPTLLVVRKDGGLFGDDDTVMVNYRIQDERYIVDTLFDKAILIAGVGDSQDRVTIVKEK